MAQDNKTVMDYDSTSTSFDDKLDDQYEQQLRTGFKGNREDYLTLRDYT